MKANLKKQLTCGFMALVGFCRISKSGSFSFFSMASASFSFALASAAFSSYLSNLVSVH
jgi:hypothetical protein